MSQRDQPADPKPYYEAHVFCCTNRRPAGHPRGCCAERGGEALRDHMKSRAKALGLKPLARVVSYTSHAQAPEWFTTAPTGAIRKLFERTGWAAGDVDLYEVNEAFAGVAMAAQHELGLDHARLNVHGGACALGHPVGATGARIVTTLLHALARRGGQRGVASLCIGGGEATAIALEML